MCDAQLPNGKGQHLIVTKTSIYYNRNDWGLYNVHIHTVFYLCIHSVHSSDMSQIFLKKRT